MARNPCTDVRLLTITALTIAALALGGCLGGCAQKVGGKNALVDKDGVRYDSIAQSENLAVLTRPGKDGAPDRVSLMATGPATPTVTTIDNELVDVQTTGPVIALSVGPWKIGGTQNFVMRNFKTYDSEGRVTSEIEQVSTSASEVYASLDAQAIALFDSLVKLGEQQALVEIEKLRTQKAISEALANALVAAVQAYFAVP